MVCPNCKGNAYVQDSVEGRGVILRRRKCKSCNYAFHTEESVKDSKAHRSLFYRLKLNKYIGKD